MNSYSISKCLKEESLWLFARDCGIRGWAPTT
jgi:hypothetical protein